MNGYDDPRLSKSARDLIDDLSNRVEISPASYWEIAIKIQRGKYQLAGPFEDFFTGVITGYGLTILPIEIRHAAILATLPRHHGDPFDRLLAAQAISEKIPLVSNDPAFDAYPVQRLW